MKIKKTKDFDKGAKSHDEAFKKAESVLSEDKPVQKISKPAGRDTQKKGKISYQPGREKKVKEVVAKVRFLRVSPRKVKLVIDVIRGMRAQEALERLQFINKKATNPVIKLLNSALANAEHNYKLNKEDLYIKKIVANQGPTLHRWQARAYGRAAAIRKRTSHLEVVLSAKDDLKENTGSKAIMAKKAKSNVEKLKEVKKEKKSLQKEPSFAKAPSSAKASEDKPDGKKESII
ncbi:50S ribosomal protein L22 [Patescibacteria group bacterium]|nr:50S ribosomal protein L22 [Patescibacteria group bacterium]